MKKLAAFACALTIFLVMLCPTVFAETAVSSEEKISAVEQAGDDAPIIYDENGNAIITDEEIIIIPPADDPQPDSEKPVSNPATGVVLAIIPVAIAIVVLIIFRKRKKK